MRNTIRDLASKIVFVLLFFSTLLYATKLPYLGRDGHIWLLSLFALMLVALNYGHVRKAVRYHRYTLLFLLLLYGWMWVSAYLSDFQSIAITYSKKYSVYILVFFSFLILTYKKQDTLSYYRLALWFFIVLAIFGGIEYLYPKMWLFSLLRTPNSLITYPQISSLMQWHNQFGIFMSIGILLAFILNKSISKFNFLIICLLFLIVIPLSGSKNAWFVLLLGISLSLYYKIVKLKGACIIIALFIFSILFFPVSTRKAGIKENNVLPLLNIFRIINNKPDTKSILGNGSFEVWTHPTRPPVVWGFFQNDKYKSKPKLNLSRDAKDGVFSIKIKTGINSEPLKQFILNDNWRYLYENYNELMFRSWVKTKSPSVLIGLYLNNNKLLFSDPHPGDGKWHELGLRVKTSEFSQEVYPEIVNLIINDPDTEATFDNVILEGIGVKEHAPFISAFNDESVNSAFIDIKLAPPVRH